MQEKEKQHAGALAQAEARLKEYQAQHHVSNEEHHAELAALRRSLEVRTGMPARMDRKRCGR